MYERAIEVLNIFYKNGYLAYIVGGYPRDFLLGIKTIDIDICTNARPVDIIKMFDVVTSSDINYGSLKIIYKNYKFDVTTFRKDIKYENNRKPIKIKYINDLKKDLLRRDFTINTLCINKDGNMLDVLSVKKDIDNKIIRTVGNPKYRIREDSLRILRAVRFATNLNFSIDSKTAYYIKKYGYELESLSVNRKKEELDKIFSSKNKEYGRSLLLSLGLDKYLGLANLDDIVMCDDIIGIWSQLELSVNYSFSKVEKNMMKNISDMIFSGVNKWSVYKNGLYVSTVVGSIKNIDYQEINNIYNNLPIYSKKDINISVLEICDLLNDIPKNKISMIVSDLEEKIVLGKLENEKDKIIKYITKNY